MEICWGREGLEGVLLEIHIYSTGYVGDSRLPSYILELNYEVENLKTLSV